VKLVHLVGFITKKIDTYCLCDAVQKYVITGLHQRLHKLSNV